MDPATLRRCRGRLTSRLPLLGGWIRRRAARALAADGSAGAAEALAEAVARTDDARVRSVALDFLGRTDCQACVDAACGVWAATRHPNLAALITIHGWVADAPLGVRVLTALAVGRPQLLVGQGAAVVKPLLDAAGDADASISAPARGALLQFKRPDARDELCRHFTREDHPLARTLALKAGYLPRDEGNRALFLFLTEQWERYETLDFDRRLLRAAYEAADAPLRQRVMERLRRSGRTDFLTVVAGSDFRARALNDREADLLVQMLAAGREWAKLWSLVFRLPLTHALQILRHLDGAGWCPDQEGDRAALTELMAFTAGPMVVSGAEARRVLPPAVRRARATVASRVNGVAFAPSQPHIAIGTGQRQVVLWDFQRARRERVVDGFQRAIGSVGFTADGHLLAAERTNRTDVPCAVHCWRDGELFTLGEHRGSVTGLGTLGDSRILTAGRDQRVAVWDAKERKLVREASLKTWPRSVCVSPEGERAALLHTGVTLISVPELEALAATGGVIWEEGYARGHGYGSGVARAAAFAPDARALIIGKLSGEVMTCTQNGRGLVSRRVQRHTGPVQGVAVLPERGIVVTASSEGEVRFTSWEPRVALGSVAAAGERLTSMRVSPDGSFMAIGDSDASMTLWDLRPLDIPSLLGRPLARALPVHLAAAGTLLEVPGLPEPVRRSLRFLECLLRHRFRYDVEIDDLPTIQAGEFDIEIEG
ncbi:MAG: hypothetical protein HY321_10245 [Armatimonadetes bacterium]|nr:hypothetical protein [Armatimonadota bacterium]